MHTYGEEFLSKTLAVIGIYYNFYCLFVLKSDEYKLLDLHRLKLIHFIFWVFVILKKFLNGRLFKQEFPETYLGDFSLYLYLGLG